MLLVLAEKPTKIHFGETNMLAQIELLKEFYTILPGGWMLHNYRYIDLRYKNQIVVRERT